LPAKDTVLFFTKERSREGLFFSSGSAMTFGAKQYPTSSAKTSLYCSALSGGLSGIKIVVRSKIQGAKILSLLNLKTFNSKGQPHSVNTTRPPVDPLQFLTNMVD
jgi:hypothetical protein